MNLFRVYNYISTSFLLEVRLVHMSKIIKIEHLPSSVFTIIFSFLWYSLTQLPLIVGDSLKKYSLIFNILGTIYVLVIAGLCIYVLSRIYSKYSTKNSNIRRLPLFRYTLVFFIVMTAYNTFCDYILPTTKNQKTIENMINGNTFFIGILLFTIIAPILEELIFRGLFINMIFKQNTFWIPVISSGIIFGSLHSASNIMEWLYYVIFGMILAAAYKKTDTLAVPIALHMINNGISFFTTF